MVHNGLTKYGCGCGSTWQHKNLEKYLLQSMFQQIVILYHTFPFYVEIWMKLHILGGTNITASPKPAASKQNLAKKVYSLGSGLYSVFHHKQYRVFCQFGAGTFDQLL